jgi:hypothetical protein
MKRLLPFVLFVMLLPVAAGAQETMRDRMLREKQGIDFQSEKAREKAKEFIRLDSNFYAGHMLEGAYMYFRASDRNGYARAIAPLEKAMNKIEKDYKWPLRTRTSDLFQFFQVYQYQQDYGFIAYFLEQAYQNNEQADKAMDVLRRVREKNMQMEFAVETYNTMAWLYHRNRVYDSGRFAFLKNSVKENNAAALRCLDSAAMKYRQDYYLNTRIFLPNFVEQQRYGIYHYKAILFAYDFQVDSAQHYYELMQDWNGFSNNNYANFKYVCGDFKTAEEFYGIAEQREDFTEKRTREFNYMRGMINIYKGEPAKADTLLDKVIAAQGSTPGFGWHSIGLARAQHYEGLTAESQDRLNKADEFAEMHIGTTWGEEQYNTAIGLYHYLNKLHEEREMLFEKNGFWTWMNPFNWLAKLRLDYTIYLLKVNVASLLANNPERADVIYPLFSSENLLSFDEVWFAISGFSNEYFITYYKKRLETDKRPKVQKYFRYMIARLLVQEGDEEEALKYFYEVLSDKELDKEYEKLLVARCYEGLSMAHDELDHSDSATYYGRELYRLYPQLLPYSEVEVEFRVKFSGDMTDPQFKTISEDFEACDIEITEDATAPLIEIEFKTNGKNKEIHYRVSDANNEAIISDAMVIKQTEDTGALLAYRIFGIKKKEIGKKINTPVIKKDKAGKDSLKDSTAVVKQPV